MRKIGLILTVFPFVMNALNIQAFITKFVSVSYAQSFAYLNVLLVAFGGLYFWRSSERLPLLVKMWIVFFVSYYLIGTLASITHQTESPYLKSLIPIIYFFSYSFFLKSEFNRRAFRHIVCGVFLISSILVVIFQWLNFSMDYDGIYEYTLERAGGVYGDANQSAVISILSFIFLYYTYSPTTNYGKILKIISLAIPAYALFLTFSKTGFVVFVLILLIASYRFMAWKVLILILAALPILSFLTINVVLQSDSLTLVQRTRIENFVNIITLNTSNVEMSGRDVLLQNMLQYVYESPVFGNGVYFSNLIRGHNTIIGVWADAGIFAFLIFVFLLIRYFTDSIKSDGQVKFFSLSILATLSIFMLSLQTIINQPYLLCIFVYLAFILRNSESRSDNNLVPRQI